MCEDLTTRELIREGMTHHRAGHLALAQSAYRRALEHDPDNSEALALLGMVAGQNGELNSAVDLFERALKHDPHNADIYHNLGETWRHLGEPLTALRCFERAVAFRPDHAEAYMSAAEASLIEASRREAAGRWGDAAGFKRKAHQHLINAARRHVESSNKGTAWLTLRRLIELDPKNAEAWALYGSTLVRPYPTQAVQALRRAIDLDPTKASTYGLLSNALALLRRDQEAEKAWAQAHSLTDFVDSWIVLIQIETLPLHEGGSKDEIFARHRMWGDAMVARENASLPRFRNSPDPERRLRIGFVSSDLRIHSVAFFLEPLLRMYNRQRYEFTCYSGVHAAGQDRMTAWLQEHASRWRDTTTMDDNALRHQVQTDEIDVLIDIGGHTGKSRLRAFAVKPAPVTVTWLGYPATTGLPTIDWRITDVIADPPGEENFHTEKLMRLDGGFLCFNPLDGAPAVAAPPALSNGYVTFGSFNNQLKINQAVIATWAKILASVQRSRLVIKSELVDDEGVRQRIKNGFASTGVALDRIELHPWISGMDRHLAAYSKIDIALDPFPYNGTTTTCEALWMGVPLVTLIGDRHSARVGFDLLSRVGLERFAALNIDAYIQIATRLANDRAMLSELRVTIREKMRLSPLCDAARFAREFEAALRTMWKMWCQSETQSAQI